MAFYQNTSALGLLLKTFLDVTQYTFLTRPIISEIFDVLSSVSFFTHYSLIILSLDDILSEIPPSSFYKLQINVLISKYVSDENVSMLTDPVPAANVNVKETMKKVTQCRN